MRKQGLAILLFMMLALPHKTFSVETTNHPLTTKSITPFLDQYQRSGSLAVEGLFEQSLVGLSYLGLGEIEKAERQMKLCQKIASQRVVALTGHQLWLALFAFQFDQVAGKKKYSAWGEALCKEVLDLPSYQGLPVMGNGKGEWGVDWECFVSLEDVRLSLSVFALAEKMTQHKGLKKRLHQRRETLSQELASWDRFPENSLVLFSILKDRDALGDVESHIFKVKENLFFVTDKRLSPVYRESEEKMLHSFWEKIQKSELKKKVVHYEKVRCSINALKAFKLWKKENDFKLYDRSHLSFLSEKEEWFLPELAKRQLKEKGVADICFEFFQQQWNPLTEIRSIQGSEQAEATYLASQAKWHLVQGQKVKAEQLAKDCVDRFGPVARTEEEKDAVASSLLVIGKIYRDKADMAEYEFKFNLSDHFEQKSDQALQKVVRHYPTASVVESKGTVRKLIEIIKDIY